MDIPAGEYLVPVDEDLSREEIIRSYFGLGFTYLELIMFLGSRHGIDLSLRHLKRLLKVYGLSRTQNRDSIDTITRLIREELSRSAGTLGYRSIHKRLLQIHHVSIDRETVRLILRELDPTGAEARLQRRLVRRTYEVNGPNYLWHLDGWDKLKPYGFSVHGCIDGFSKKIMWLEVGASNKDPFVVAGHFADTIKRLKGLPNIVRADRGTENVNIERIQSHLRALNTDQRGHLQMSFLYGKSTSNQRIESWWNQLKQQGMQFWRDHFKELVSVGIMDTSDYVNIHCARFCYMDLLRRELDKIKVLWNTHHIRKSRNRLSPCGKPDVIFHFPELYDSRDYLQPLHHEDLSQMAELLTRDIEDCDPTACELFIDIMSEARVHMPTTIKEADDLLVFLLDMVQSMEI